jgi:hypothetical protein
MPKVAVLDLALHFQVRQRREQHRVPVHEALAAVDQALFMEPHKHFGDGAREALVHGETVSRPVHRISEAAHLC